MTHSCTLFHTPTVTVRLLLPTKALPFIHGQVQLRAYVSSQAHDFPVSDHGDHHDHHDHGHDHGHAHDHSEDLKKGLCILAGIIAFLVIEKVTTGRVPVEARRLL